MNNVVARAANILRTDGWVTGTMRCGTGERCAVGALRAACNLDEHSHYVSLPTSSRSAYMRGLHALAEAINPRYRTSKVMRVILRDVAEDHDLPRGVKFDDLTPAQKRSALETYVIEFNDGKTESAAGRNAVLSRFDKAAAALSA